MMIDSALEARKHQTLDPAQAIEEACLVRFRLIIMNTLTALMEALPIAMGLGAGAEARRPLLDAGARPLPRTRPPLARAAEPPGSEGDKQRPRHLNSAPGSKIQRNRAVFPEFESGTGSPHRFCAMNPSLCAALAALWLFCQHPAFGQEPVKPNIIVVLVDDLGYADIGPFGATQQKTPHLDRMAREGMKLSSFYAAPVCSVSRAQLLTGCYGARISVPGVYGPGAKNGLNPAEFTIAERLKERGYATLCVGKWHVGDQHDFLPTRQGFDHYFGLPYSNDMQRKPLNQTDAVVPLIRDEKVEELLTDADQSSLTERYTEEALGFIRAHQNKPFLLYFPHTAVHTPISPGAAFSGKSANGRFGDWVEEVDWSTGRILDTLRELKIEGRTLVIFTSDNGPWLVKKSDAGSALPLRGGKGSTWEGGVRVPALAWWPGQIAPGSESDAITGSIDLLPTAVALAGGILPAHPVIDGRDISPVLLGKTRQSPRETHYYFNQYELQAVRQGPWKLAISPQHLGSGLPIPPDAASKQPRLYHLVHDLAETVDVAGQNPETVERLLSVAGEMQAEIGGTKPTARRPAGSVEQPTMLYRTLTTRREASVNGNQRSTFPSKRTSL